MSVPAWSRKGHKQRKRGAEANGPAPGGSPAGTDNGSPPRILGGALPEQGNGASASPPHPLVGELEPLLWQAGVAAWLRERSRRAVNVMAAGVLLLLALPLMALVALSVKVSSKGPVFFAQTRVGLDRRNGGSTAEGDRRQKDYGGKLFRLYKFRTMQHRASHEADAQGSQVWASPDDPRITPVGGILRRTRVDELPQLWNVLKGDMNLVGPRPEQPEIVRDLSRKIDRYAWRHRVRPGITGWAQVNHPYDQSLDDVRRKVTLDLEYMHRRSALEDLRIMARTVPVMLFRKGAW